MPRFIEKDGKMFDEGAEITAKYAVNQMNDYRITLLVAARQINCGCTDMICPECLEYAQNLKKEIGE
jgi:hypothetical protein